MEQAKSLFKTIGKEGMGNDIYEYMQNILSRASEKFQAKVAAEGVDLQLVAACVDDAGSINLDSREAQAVMGMDVTAELTKLDLRTGMLEIVAAVNDDNESMKQLESLRVYSLVLPVAKKIVMCEAARNKCDAAEADTDAETKFLQAFQDMSKEMTSVVQGSSTDLAAKLSAYREKVVVPSLIRIAEQLVKEIKEAMAGVQAVLIDTTKIANKLPDPSALKELINFEGRHNLLEHLKQLQGTQNRGLRHFERVVAALNCANISTLGDGEEISEIRKNAISVRQHGRLQVACRSAAVVVRDSRADEVSGLFAELKQLHVTLPRKLKAMIEGTTTT